MGARLLPAPVALLLGVLCTTATSTAWADSIDIPAARECFRAAQSACSRDAGQLWGVSLCGPILLVDPQTRALVANQADAQGHLTARDSVFVGNLPKEEVIANTAVTWAGVKWTMVMWPLPDRPAARLRLVMHELFHRVQDDLGLPATSPPNPHLDSHDGRLWLQLEWRALRAALAASGDARSHAVSDALLFRACRRASFPDAAASERALEMNEGLAEYTGARLAAASDAALGEAAARGVERAAERPSFVRSFAYVSGPLYGALLDAVRARWRADLTPQKDLGELLGAALGIAPLPARSAADLVALATPRAAAYAGDALKTAEDAREKDRQRRIAAYRARLIDGPVLVVPMGKTTRSGFDPNNVIPLEKMGTIYPTYDLSDEWGVLEVKDGALTLGDFGKDARAQVAAPADPQARPLQGPGWKLQLAPGWTVVPGPRAGDFQLAKKSG
jgi:hypothetical protein